jgi:hypothetical protein
VYVTLSGTCDWLPGDISGALIGQSWFSQNLYLAYCVYQGNIMLSSGILGICIKITQRNTNRTASHKSMFNILHEVISYLFTLTSSLFRVLAANDNFTVHKIISSLNITDLYPVLLIVLVILDVSSH